MNKLFHNYPPLLRFLIPLLVLQQISFFLFFQQLEINFYEEFELTGIFLRTWIIKEYYYILAGISFIIGGYLHDFFKDMQKVLLYTLSGMLLGHSLIILPINILPLFGGLIYLFSSCLFFIKVFLNIAVLFPIANDYKDNSLAISYLLPFIVISLFFILISMLYTFRDYSIGLYIVCIIIYLLLLYVIYQNKDLGYSILDEDSEEEEENHKRIFRWSLTGGILLSFLALFSTSNLTYIATLASFSSGLDSLISVFGDLNSMGSAILTLIVLGILFYMFRNAREHSTQVSKILIGLLVLGILYLLDIGNLMIESWTLEYIISALPYYISTIFITIPVMSIITHLNIGKKSGLWFGLLIGCPFIVNQVCSLIIAEVAIFQGAAIISFILVIAAFIYLQENQDFIVEQLALNDPNQEVEVENEDPFDHLIED